MPRRHGATAVLDIATERSQAGGDADITAKLLAAGKSPLEPVFEALLREFDPLVATVAKVGADTTELLEQTKAANQKFAAERVSDAATQDRERVLNDLSAKFEAFVELRGNLEEGSKFYANLKTILGKYQNKCADFVFARSVEKKSLLSCVAEPAARRTDTNTRDISRMAGTAAREDYTQQLQQQQQQQPKASTPPPTRAPPATPAANPAPVPQQPKPPQPAPQQQAPQQYVPPPAQYAPPTQYAPPAQYAPPTQARGMCR